MNSELQRKGRTSFPRGKIEMKLEGKKDPADRAFEIFICKDGFVEFYDVENPKEGFYFGGFKELRSFANSLNSILKTIPGTDSRV